MGFASAQPILVWGPGSQEGGIGKLLFLAFLLSCLSVSLFDREPFLRPDHDPAEAPRRSRSQGWPPFCSSGKLHF
jgi:hypothetical protein